MAEIKTRKPRAKKVEEAAEPQGVNITVEQILAAIVYVKGPISITLEDLLGNYSGKQISITQDTDEVIFELVDEA
jgi:hypothetical protein